MRDGRNLLSFLQRQESSVKHRLALLQSCKSSLCQPLTLKQKTIRAFLCDSLTSYMFHCLAAEIKVQPWMERLGFAWKCPEGKKQ